MAIKILTTILYSLIITDNEERSCFVEKTGFDSLFQRFHFSLQHKGLVSGDKLTVVLEYKKQQYQKNKKIK